MPFKSIGLYSDRTIQVAIEYYVKVRQHIEPRDVLIVDRMLAADNSAVAAVDRRLKEVNPKSIKFLGLLAAPEGIEHFHQQHSIVPGLIHAGDGLHPATLRL